MKTLAVFVSLITLIISTSAQDDDSYSSVFSNSNVNLGNLASLENLGQDGQFGPKLTGPNVCTKQEP